MNNQKKIAQLEIQNNILRKEIHNTQYDRVRLLKRSTDMKNLLEEMEWERENTRIKQQQKKRKILFE